MKLGLSLCISKPVYVLRTVTIYALLKALTPTLSRRERGQKLLSVPVLSIYPMQKIRDL